MHGEIKMHGGARPGAGRPAGSITQKTRKAADRETDTAEMPLEFMLRLMRDETVPLESRIEMALAAAPYCHPRLNALAVRNTDSPRTVNNFQIELVVPNGHEISGETIDAAVLRIGPPQ